MSGIWATALKRKLLFSRLRIALLFALGVTVVVWLVEGFHYVGHLRRVEYEAESILKEDMLTLLGALESLEHDAHQYTPEAFSAAIARFPFHPSTLWSVFRGDEPTPWLLSPRGGLRIHPPEGTVLWTANDILHFHWTWEEQEYGPLHLVTSYPLSWRIREITRQSLREILVYSLLALAVGFLLGWVYAGWSLRSLEEGLHLYDHILLQGAHDLKTPLALLRLEISRLPQETSRARIQAALRRLEQLADDILFLAEGRTPEPSIRKISLKQRLEDLLELFQEEVRIRRLRIERVCEEDLVVDADPQALDRLLVNLLDNAVRYSPEGATLRLELCPPTLILENPVGVPDPLGEGVGWAVIRTVVRQYSWSVHRSVDRGVHRVELRFAP